MRKTRPCLVVSPDELNDHISTVIVAPMTSKGRKYTTRVTCPLRGVWGQIVLDPIRTVDKKGLLKKRGRVSAVKQDRVLASLAEMFGK